MIVTLDGIEYDCDFTIEEHGYPSNNWDDPGAPTIVAITSIYVNEEKLAIIPTEIREKLEELIAFALDDDLNFFDSEDD